MAGKEKPIQKATQVALGKLIDLARASDPSALKTLSEYGLNPGKAGVFRFISEGEVNNILNGGRYLGRFGDGRVDVTSNDAITTGLSDAFRVKYKPEFDLYKGGDRVRLKNEELGDGWLLGGYDLNDVAAVQKKLQDGTYMTIYDPSLPEITSENAASITPEQWTAAQDVAIARGDMAEAQRLRDLHFLTNSNTSVLNDFGMPLHTYHGSPNTDITEFRHVPPKTGGRGTGTEGFYVTSNKSYADRYKARHLMRPSELNNGKIYDLYVNAKKVITFPDDFPSNTSVSFITNMNAPERAFLENNGYDGIKLGKFLNNSTGKRPEMAVLNSNQLKSADAVTYDDNGVRIPLGDRDNFNINDIRWLLIPTAAGLSIKAVSDNTFDKPLYNPNSPIF